MRRRADGRATAFRAAIVLAGIILAAMAGVCAAAGENAGGANVNASPSPGASPTPAASAFSWRAAAGSSVRVMLSRHPYSDSIKLGIANFENLTGIRVAYIILPEEDYFAHLSSSLNDNANSPDVYMTGACQLWEYAAAGKMLALDPFIQDSGKTRQGYNAGDFFPVVTDAFRWNGKPGAAPGEGALWAAPIGFETAGLIYNREVLSRHRLAVPTSLEELLATGKALANFGGSNSHAVAARGARGLHSGYMAAFTGYGGRDMEMENGRLVARVNSPEGVKATELWLRLLTECGPAGWAEYDWEDCLEDIGAGRTAILCESDIIGYHANAAGATGQSGKLGFAPAPTDPDRPAAEAATSLWAWGLAVNPGAADPNAAWLFTQYFTSREFQLHAAREGTGANPPRKSVFDDPAFQNGLTAMEGYSRTVSAGLARARVPFTPTPHHREIAERWAATLRDIASGFHPSAQAGLDYLAEWMNERLADVGVE